MGEAEDVGAFLQTYLAVLARMFLPLVMRHLGLVQEVVLPYPP